MRKRAKDFFHDLCELMRNEGSPVDESYKPASIKSKHKVEDGQSSFGEFCDNLKNYSPTEPQQHMSQNCITTGRINKMTITGQINHRRNTFPITEGIESKRLRTEDVLPTSNALNYTVPTDISADFEQFVGERSMTDVFLSDYPSMTMARSNSSSSSSGCSSLQDSTESQEPDGDLPTPTEDDERDTDCSDPGFGHPTPLLACPQTGNPTPTSCLMVNSVSTSGLVILPFNDKVFVSSFKESVGVHSKSSFRTFDPNCSLFTPPTIHLFDKTNWGSGEGPPALGFALSSSLACPNVSLSPLLEHRISSLSSVSSGRNSSFDDSDVVPQMVGDVLVVSHGGLLKELVNHFIEDFHCKVPGGKDHALRICPNTGISRFMVTLSDDGQPPAITCLLIHDKEHLSTLS